MHDIWQHVTKIFHYAIFDTVQEKRRSISAHKSSRVKNCVSISAMSVRMYESWHNDSEVSLGKLFVVEYQRFPVEQDTTSVPGDLANDISHLK